MITVYVRLKLPEGMTREQWLAHAKRIAENFRDLPGLLRKNFILGEDGYGGGIYTWTDRKTAETFYAGPWRAGIIEMFGTPPEFTWFDSPVIVDNEAGRLVVDDAGFRRDAA
jgi:hypothetical protein